MKLGGKIIVTIAVLTLVALIGSMIYFVSAKYQMNEYAVQIGNVFNAATIVNATETYTDEERAVIATYNGESSVIVPENYKALMSYLRRDHARPLFGSVKKENALHISICGQSHLYIAGDKDGQGATILLENMGDSFVMHVAGGDLWDKIVDMSLKGTARNPNIPLAENP